MAQLLLIPETSKNSDHVVSKLHIELDGIKCGRIEYRFDGDVLPSVSASKGWALLALIHYAMEHGHDVHCEGRVERSLLDNLEEYQRAWFRWKPTLYRQVDVSVGSEFDAVPALGRAAVQAFSGGVDSVFSLHAHQTGLLGRNALDVKAALFLHLEGWSAGHDDELQRYEDLAAIAACYDVPLTVVKTNVRDFHKHWSFSHIAAIASALMQFEGVVDRGIVAADFSYENEILGWGNNCVANQMIGGKAFSLVTTGAGWGRTAKARALKSNRPVLERLRVCHDSARGSKRNCGQCEKCIRTKLNFVAAGQTDLPALEDVPTVQQVRSLCADNTVTRSFFKDLLEEGDWAGQEPLRKAVASVANLSETVSPWARAKRLARKLNRRPGAKSH